MDGIDRSGFRQLTDAQREALLEEILSFVPPVKIEPGSITVRMYMERMGLSHEAARSRLQRLEESGLLERHNGIDPKTRRACHVWRPAQGAAARMAELKMGDPA